MLPLIAFGGAYYLYDIYAATIALILAMTALLAYKKLRDNSIHKLLWVSYFLVLVFGGLTLALQDKIFLQWKPTLFAWFIALVLVGGELFAKRSLLASMISGLDIDFHLPSSVWRRLSLGWAAGMLLKGGLNLYFAFYQSEAAWVTFKIAGQFVLTLVYIMLTLFYLRHYLPALKADQES